MSEMNVEKKIEIEKYIIKSYFGGGKNIEAYVNGADLISGSGGIPDLLVEVESFNDEMITVRWDILSEFGSEYKNEFMMVLARERSITRNRCDSVDYMMYAWEAWRSKIQGKPIFLKTNDEDLQKDKRIEELEREIKALRAEKEVMERHIQELESQNVSLAETNKDKNCIEFKMRSMMVTHKPYQDHSDIEITGIIPDREIFAANNPFDIPCDVVVIPKRDFKRLQAENEQLKKKLHEYDPLPEFHEILKKLYSTNDIENLEWTINHVCGGRSSVNGWIAVSSFWKQNYETLSKLVGFSSTEEIQDYLTNEAECYTLHEALASLEYNVKFARDERRDLSKKLEECEKDYISERDRAEALQKEIGVYSRTLKEWKEGTGCPSPSAAKTMIECQASWCHAYHEVKEANEKLADCIHQWQKVTGYDNSKDFLKWKANIEGIVEAWKSETGCKYPGEARVLLEKWKTLTKCETPEAAATWIASYEKACERGNELAEKVEEWKKATGRINPEEAKQYIDRLKDRLNKIHDCSVDW